MSCLALLNGLSPNAWAEDSKEKSTGIFSCSAEAPYVYRQDRTLEDLFASNPEIFTEFFERIDLSSDALEGVQEKVAEGNLVEAARQLLAYYKNRPLNAELNLGSPSATSVSANSQANRILQYDFVFSGERRKVAVRPDGLRDWHLEWPHYSAFRDLFVRHEYFDVLLKAWQESKDPRYARGFDEIVTNWMIHSELQSDQPAPAPIDNELSCGIRLGGSWPRAFFGFQDAPEFSEATRFLMLRSIERQARYLFENPGKTRYKNIDATIYTGILKTSVVFPEFKGGAHRAEVALKKITDIYAESVFPDGMETEMSTRYATNFAEQCGEVYGLARQAGIPLKDDFLSFMENQWNIHFYLSHPNGDAANFGDSYQYKLTEYFSNNPELWKRFPREDWLYISSNGAKGKEPEGSPSRAFSDSGKIVMRDGWGRDAQWSLFDLGPKGSSGHGHQDKLNLLVDNGRPILVDSGKPVYDNKDGAPWVEYFRGSAGHNVLLFDGRGQAAPESGESAKLVEGRDFILSKDYIYARGSVDRFARLKFSETSSLLPAEALKGVRHSREVLYYPGKFWIVVDKVAPGTFHKLEALWHFSGDCAPHVNGIDVSTREPGLGNLSIIPFGTSDWKVRIVKGQTEPSIQGWQRSDRGARKSHYGGNPIPVAVYESTSAPETFGWLLYPWKGKQPDIEVKESHLTEDTISLTISVDGVVEKVEFRRP